jgi:hypothetical protein
MLVVLLVSVNIPYFSSRFLPAHDTKHCFSVFLWVYSHFFYEFAIPNWFPYGQYGIDGSLFWLSALTPSCYATGLIGSLLRVRDALLLFKMSVLIDQLVLLLGTYLLCRRLFPRRITTVFVCIGMICSTVWYYQLFLNFKIYYLVPLLLFFYIRFYLDRRPRFLYIACLLGLISLMGNAIYFLSLWLYLFIIVSVPLLLRFGAALRCLFQHELVDYVTLVLLVSVATAWVLTLQHSTDGLAWLTHGRDEATGKVLLSDFLTYGGIPKPGEVGLEMLAGTRTTVLKDNTYYIGLLPLALVFYAVVRVRNTCCYALLLGCAALVGLSFGGWVARAAYHFPLMPYYRHIGLVYGLVKLLLLLCSGFGLERFLSGLESAHRPWQSLAPIIALTGAGLAAFALVRTGLPGPFEFGSRFLGLQNSLTDRTQIHNLVWHLFCLRLGTYALGVVCLIVTIIAASRGAIGAYSLARVGSATAVVCLLADGLAYQVNVYLERPKLPPDLASRTSSLWVRPVTFQDRRGYTPSEEYQRDRLALLCNMSLNGATHCYFYNAIQFDPVRPADPNYPVFRMDNVAVGMKRLLEARGGALALWVTRSFLPAHDSALLAALGSAAPKLRLVRRSIAAASEKEAWDLVRRTPEIDQVVVLIGRSPSGGDAASVSAAGKVDTVAVREFSADHLTAEVEVADGGAWLVYADGYHPAWRAAVDGHVIPVFEANLAFKAVHLSEGRHIVCFSYREGSRGASKLFLVMMGVLFALTGSATVISFVLSGLVASWPRTISDCKPHVFPQ